RRDHRLPRPRADAPRLHPRLRTAAAIAAPRGAGGGLNDGRHPHRVYFLADLVDLFFAGLIGFTGLLAPFVFQQSYRTFHLPFCFCQTTRYLATFTVSESLAPFLK